MFDNKRKNNWTYAITEAIKVIRATNFFILLALLNLKDWGIFAIFGILVLAIIVGLYKFTITKFYIRDNVLIIEKGHISRTKLELPFEKINTVDQEENIVSKIFDVCTLKVDSGANKLAGEEVKLHLTIEESILLKEIILKGKSEDSDKEEILTSKLKKEKTYKYEKEITFKELLIYGLTKGKLLGTISFIFIVMGISGTLNDALDYDILSKAMGIAEQSTAELLKTKVAIILFVIVLLLGSYIVINLITIGYEAVRLYNFKVASDDKNIYISYGLIKTKQYTIALNKIHSLKLKQSLIQQYFKLYTIEATAIGYGDEQNEKAIVFPIANIGLVEEVIKSILPQFNKNISKHNQSMKYVKVDVVKNIIFNIVVVIIVSLFNVNIIITLTLFIALTIISLLLTMRDYKNTTLGVDKDLLFISTGAIYKETSIIRQSSIQSIAVKEGPIARKIGVVEFVISIYTNKILEMVNIDGIDKNLEEEIINNMDM